MTFAVIDLLSDSQILKKVCKNDEHSGIWESKSSWGGIFIAASIWPQSLVDIQEKIVGYIVE
jgi:hypothetical protein